VTAVGINIVGGGPFGFCGENSKGRSPDPSIGKPEKKNLALEKRILRKLKKN
jgi:hypothetical protein